MANYMERCQNLNQKDMEAVLVIIVFYAVMELSGISCPIRFLTGISCAGCGMSRAWLSLLRLDIVAAFHYHPLFLLPILAVGLLMFRPRLNQHLFRVGMHMICGAFIIVYFIRLFSPGDVIVTFEPLQGVISQVLFRR